MSAPAQVPVPVPNYRRQRLLLLLLEEAGGELDERDLQKLLFLVRHEGKLESLDFVPYRYGCYSFQAASDLELLQKRGWIAVDKTSFSLLHRLPQGMAPSERGVVAHTLAKHRDRRGAELVRYVYRQHPYYAINSKLTSLLDKAGMESVEAARDACRHNDTVLFTIGYEGLSFEAYVNKLIRAGVRLLCDVRHNAWSRKFGFSGGMLSEALPRMNIKYLHVAELGIDPARRRSLRSRADYRRLFAGYRKTLPRNKAALARVLESLQQYGRVALTCFEQDPHSCHRHCVSAYLAANHGAREEHL